MPANEIVTLSHLPPMTREACRNPKEPRHHSRHHRIARRNTQPMSDEPLAYEPVYGVRGPYVTAWAIRRGEVTLTTVGAENAARSLCGLPPVDGGDVTYPLRLVKAPAGDANPANRSETQAEHDRRQREKMLRYGVMYGAKTEYGPIEARILTHMNARYGATLDGLASTERQRGEIALRKGDRLDL